MITIMAFTLASLAQEITAWHSQVARPLVVILGPTASGKTGLSIALAESLQNKKIFCEIVNADSRQLYRFLSIGTAKITKEEMHDIPHHLLDCLDPKEEATAAWYKKSASRVIDDIHTRHHVPMLVGGSMLYISAIIDGLNFPLESDPKLRKSLEEEYAKDNGETLHKKLQEIDPEAALGIPKQNSHYLIRALEMYTLTGKTASSLRTASECPYDLFIIGVERDREELAERISRRTKELFAQGWIEEVRDLLQKGYTSSDPGMKSHGYAEIMNALEEGNMNIDHLTQVISAKTRQYAKRQMTWWRHDERIRWLKLT